MKYKVKGLYLTNFRNTLFLLKMNRKLKKKSRNIFNVSFSDKC